MKLSTLVLVAAILTLGFALTGKPAAAAEPAACTVSVQIINAPFAVVDSNKPGIDGPKVFTLGARITNTGGAAMTDVQVHIGNGSTPGVFAAGLSMLPGGNGTYYLGEMDPGQSVTAYWQVRYPFTYDVTYPYTIWVTAPGGCSSARTGYITTQSEISATANKLLPTGAVMQVYPSVAPVGGLVNVRITGFELGTIGQGPRPLSPYDAWLQPVGNLDFDPSCMRLVRSQVSIASVTGGPVNDRLYFSGIGNYSSSPSDYVTYTFLVLRSCSTVVQPYQEAASGTQEKYNGDYEASSSRATVSGGGSSAAVQVQTSNQSPAAGETLHITSDFQSTAGPLGYPDNGNPIVTTVSIGDETTYVAGSATCDLPGELQYSTDGGITWQSNEPADPSTVTHLRCLLDDPLDANGGSLSYDAVVDGSYTGGAITVSSEVWLLDNSVIGSDSLVMNGDPEPTPTPPPPGDPGVGGGTGGGLESGPLPGDPSAFIGGIGQDELGRDAGQADGPQAGHKARLLVPMSLTLGDLLPDEGPEGTIPTDVVPVDVLATTSAPDARAVDFVDAQGVVRAVALGVHTLDGPYEHDYGVCGRFKGYTFDEIEPISLPGLDPANPAAAPWFWHARSRQGVDFLEEAILFHIFVDEANHVFHLDSRWIQNSYPANLGFDFDYVFNMQVWSTNRSTSQALLASIVERLGEIDGGTWQLVFHNQQPAADPQVFANQVTYEADVVRLSLENRHGQDRQVQVYGTWRSYADRLTSIPFEYTVSLPPGQTVLALPFPGLLDTTIFIDDGDFVDKVYTGGGLWFVFSNTEAATAEMSVEECRGLAGIDENDLLLAGCLTVTGTDVNSPDQVGLGRTLNPNGRPVDVSPYLALRFWARGDGNPIRILLETEQVGDGDFHQVVFTPASQWQQVIIPLDQFSQRGFGTPVPLNTTGIKAVIWINADATSGSYELSVDQVSFTNSALFQPAALPEDGPDTGDRPVSIETPSEFGVAQATLHYSLDDGETYQGVAMAGGAGEYTGAIPGQQLGSDISFFVELEDVNGYVSRSPLDAESSTYRYRVDDRPGLLVEDFAGGRLSNRLGGRAGLFNSPQNGGQLRAYQVESQLILDYLVDQPGQFAGYFTQLGELDASAYTTLNLLVRGAEGSEQLLVSLRDATGYEPRLSAGDLLPGGIGDRWQWVQLPLAAFPGSLDLSRLTSLALTFADGYGAPAGQIMIKEIRFTSLVAPVIVDTFDDGNDLLNGRGLSHWQAASGGSLTTTHVAGRGYTGTGYALRVDYAVAPGQYVMWSSDVGSAQVAGDAQLTFWVRGSSDGLLPNIYLDDGHQRAYVPLGDYVSLSSSWQQVTIPLAAFASQGINPDHIHAVQVAFEFGNGSGRLWLDDIMIGSPGSAQAERRVLHINGNGLRALALHLPAGQAWQAASSARWLVAPAGGSGPVNLTINTVDLGLEPGQYVGDLTVTTAQGQAEHVTVHLALTGAARGHYLFLPVMAR